MPELGRPSKCAMRDKEREKGRRREITLLVLSREYPPSSSCFAFLRDSLGIQRIIIGKLAAQQSRWSQQRIPLHCILMKDVY